MALNQKQIEIRKKGIGASEVAAIAGLSPWKSPQDVWMDKTGRTGPKEETEDMERGNELEQAIIQWTARREGVIAGSIGLDQQTVIKPDDPIVIATPDGLAYEAAGSKVAPFAVMEAKAPGRTADHWTDPAEQPDGVPVYYYPQIQWQMAATGLDHTIVGALVWGRLQIYRLDFSPAFYERLREKAGIFWRYVETDTPPPVTNAAKAQAWIKTWNAEQRSEDMIELSDADLADAATIYKEADAAEKAWKGRKNAAAAALINRIGDHAGIVGPGYRATYKQTKGSDSIDWQGIAKSLAGPQGIPASLSQAFTTNKPGYRRINVKLIA